MARLIMLALASMFALGTTAHAGGVSANLLLSSAWCNFTYNKTTGYSNSTRVYFNANGTYGTGSRGEGYASGNWGNMASQRDAGGGGLWQVHNGELFISEGGGPLQPVATVVKRNSNGYPVIVADGAEYSQCR